jgi:predicted acyltransferase
MPPPLLIDNFHCPAKMEYILQLHKFFLDKDEFPSKTIYSEMQPSQRLLSLDFLRGFIMVLLALDSTGLYGRLIEATEGSSINTLFIQLEHHPWNGLRFWDLIQPGFMFIAGTAMAYSLHKQKELGVPWSTSLKKALRRSGWLFFWGVLDYAVKRNGLAFELWDVLTQLSFTTLVAFLIFNWSFTRQFVVCVFLLLLTEFLYRFTNIPGFSEPFTDQRNFGNWMDLQLMNKINRGGWVAINCIPTAVHTIAGAMVGKYFLQSSLRPISGAALKPILIAGLASLVAGLALDFAGITPIIKRIATTSFTLASLGWCLFALALCFWWIDVKKHQNGLKFFTIVGMNSIFIYLFFEIVGSRWFNGYVAAITNGLMSFINMPETPMQIITCLCIFTLEWLLCYFLYKKKIFFRV